MKNNINYSKTREAIKQRVSNREAVIEVLLSIGIDVSRSFHFKVREERTPSAHIYTNGSVYDFGEGKNYSDIVSLLFDGYKAFQTLQDTTLWVADYFNITVEVYCETQT